MQVSKIILYFNENFLATSSKQPQTLGQNVERPSPHKTLPTYKFSYLIYQVLASVGKFLGLDY